MRGSLDMSNNKIINVAEPTELRDVCTKFYVDDSIRRLTTSTNGLIDQRISDERQSINAQFLDNKGLIRSDKLPPITIKQHFYTLDIGESHTVPYKLTKFEIPLSYDRTTNVDLTPKYLKLSKQMIIVRLYRY